MDDAGSLAVRFPTLVLHAAVIVAVLPLAALRRVIRVAAVIFVSNWPPRATPLAMIVVFADPDDAVTAQVAPGTVASRTVGLAVLDAPNGRTAAAVDCAGETKRVVPAVLPVFKDSA